MADKELLEKVFNDFDQDKSGKIDAKELRNVIREYYSLIGETVDDARVDSEVGTILAVVDTSGDGKLDKNEFMNYMLK